MTLFLNALRNVLGYSSPESTVETPPKLLAKTPADIAKEMGYDAYSWQTAPLHNCVVENKIRELKRTLASIDNYTLFKENDNGYTALHLAVALSNTNAIDALLNCIKDPDIRNQFICRGSYAGNTALHLCAYIQNEEMAERIANKLIDAVAQDKKKEFVFQKNSDGNTALHHAVALSNTNAIDALLNCIKDSDTRNQFICEGNGVGNTALHLCAYIQDKAKAKEIANKLVWYVLDDAVQDHEGPGGGYEVNNKRDFVFQMNRDKKTALRLFSDNELLCSYKNKKLQFFY